jgi:hypothetical protein
MWTAVSMVVIVISMVGVGILVWKKVGTQEHGDDAFEAMLRADDERAEAGRRRRAGLPPKPPSVPGPDSSVK